MNELQIACTLEPAGIMGPFLCCELRFATGVKRASEGDGRPGRIVYLGGRHGHPPPGGEEEECGSAGSSVEAPK